MEAHQQREVWEDGVSLGSAWWVYADLQKKTRFRALQQSASPADPARHEGLRRALEDEVVGRLSSGELQAFGIEFGSNGEPTAIPRNYFWKGVEVDFDSDTVAALGRKFGQVTVQGKREPITETLPDMPTVDLGEILAAAKPGPGQELLSDSEVIPEPELEPAPMQTDEAYKQALRRGRPSKEEEIEGAINILLARGIDLTTMPRPNAYNAIKNCARTELKSNTKIGFSDPVIQRALFRRFGRRR
jgi:hypothetical protein